MGRGFGPSPFPLGCVAVNYGKQRSGERAPLLVLDGKFFQAQLWRCVTLGKSLHLSEPVSFLKVGLEVKFGGSQKAPLFIY